MNLILKHAWRVLTALALWLAAVPASAGLILQPIDIHSPQDTSGPPNHLFQMIIKNGLSANYTSGVTDFDSYTATTTHNSAAANSGYTGSAGGLPQYISFDLGSVQTIGAIAFWAAGPAGPVGGSVTEFNLYQDDDFIVLNGTGPLMGIPFTALANGGPTTPAQIFTFAPTTTRFVVLRVNGTDGGISPPGIGEVAFAIVPEPGSLTLLAVGVMALAARGRHRRRTRCGGSDLPL